MSSRGSTPLELKRIIIESSVNLSTPSPINAFTLLGQPKPTLPAFAYRDKCQRPPPIYNDNYNPNLPPNLDKPVDYSPFVPGEPLFDDRPIHTPSLKRHYTVCIAPGRLRTHWV